MVKSPFPKMGIMKRTTKGKEYTCYTFYNVCVIVAVPNTRKMRFEYIFKS